jgi:CRP-like cAMP-binding protein
MFVDNLALDADRLQIDVAISVVAGTDLFFLLDGVLEVDVDGRVVAEVGPGVILGEHAALSGGTRTATLRAIAPVRVAVVPGDAVDRAALEEIGAGHRRETDA